MLIHPWDAATDREWRDWLAEGRQFGQLIAVDIDDPAAKADLLRQQLAAYDMATDHAPVAVDEPPYGRLLSGIRGIVLHIREVKAKFEYDDRKSVATRQAVAARLAHRDQGHDNGARRQQLRRIDQRTDDCHPV